MYQYLRTITSSLMNKTTNWPDHSVLIKVLTLLMIYHKCELLSDFCSDQSNSAMIQKLLRNLVVDKLSYEAVYDKMLTTYPKPIEKILHLLLKTANNYYPPMIEWTFAVPLLHFLTKQCNPHEELQTINWNSDKKVFR